MENKEKKLLYEEKRCSRRKKNQDRRKKSLKSKCRNGDGGGMSDTEVKRPERKYMGETSS